MAYKLLFVHNLFSQTKFYVEPHLGLSSRSKESEKGGGERWQINRWRWYVNLRDTFWLTAFTTILKVMEKTAH